MYKRNAFLVLTFIFLSSCENLDYKRPTMPPSPAHFQEAGINWQQAKPNADYDRGDWWKIYNDNFLNDLEEQFNKNNQNTISAEESYKSALALVTSARAAYFPNITGSEGLARQKTVANNSNNNSSTSYNYNNTQTFNLTSSWEIDVFNQIKYSVDSNVAAAKSAKANWASIKLSGQTSLAQYYFEMRALDVVQKNLDEIVVANLAAVKYEENRYKAGVDDQLTLLNYRNNYQTSLQNAQNNRITRAQYQHAIAVLIGKSPSDFIITPYYETKFTPATIPLVLPSELVERRPDVADAEYQVMQANAQIGVARSAFFPILNLGTSTTWSNQNNYGPLFDLPQLLWSVGPQLSFAIFDGGSRLAQSKSAKALYEAQVATYRNTVLSAFQEVEDQLVAVKYLNAQEIVLKKVKDNNALNLTLTKNQYKQGIIDNYAVINAKISYYNAAVNLANLQSLQKSAEISLIKALGGGWKEEVVIKDEN